MPIAPSCASFRLQIEDCRLKIRPSRIRDLHLESSIFDLQSAIRPRAPGRDRAASRDSIRARGAGQECRCGDLVARRALIPRGRSGGERHCRGGSCDVLPALIGSGARADRGTRAGTSAMTEPIVVVAYNPDWPKVFAALRGRVAGVLGDLALAVEQVGSPAVPGLAAKPIVDLDVLIPSTADFPAAVERLATLGYVHQGDLGIPGREAIIQP